MGYYTYFSGSLSIEPPLNEDERSFLTDFSGSRRMKRLKGPLYVGDDASDVIDHNDHSPQPWHYTLWEATEDGRELCLPDDSIKAYFTYEWLQYLLDNLLSGDSAREFIDENFMDDPRLISFTCDHVLNGAVEAQGEDPDDKWRMVVENSKLKLQRAEFTWVDASS